MEKRYQVFVSSTFHDLIQERQSVQRAILEMGHMPAGMELFPATDEAAWVLIKEVIDASDYYVVIVGGRYGSLDEAGIGYTEREYDYARQAGKPILALLHQNPDGLPRDKTESDAVAWAKLKAFRAKVEAAHHCKYWNTPEDLQSKAIISVSAAIKRSPAPGWIRADRMPSDATLTEILKLRARVAELESQLATQSSQAPPGSDELVQGDELFETTYKFAARIPEDLYPYEGDINYEQIVRVTWNELFAEVAPMMINETSDNALKTAIESAFVSKGKPSPWGERKLTARTMANIVHEGNNAETAIVQFRALGLITQSVRPRSVKDSVTYWTLTKRGDDLMTALRAIRRTRD